MKNVTILSHLTRWRPGLLKGEVRSGFGAPLVRWHRHWEIAWGHRYSNVTCRSSLRPQEPWRGTGTNLRIVIDQGLYAAQVEDQQGAQQFGIRLALKGVSVITEGQVEGVLIFVILGGCVHGSVLVHQRGRCRRWLVTDAQGTDRPAAQAPAYFTFPLTISNTGCERTRQRRDQHGSHYLTDASFVLLHMWRCVGDVTAHVTPRAPADWPRQEACQWADGLAKTRQFRNARRHANVLRKTMVLWGGFPVPASWHARTPGIDRGDRDVRRTPASGAEAMAGRRVRIQSPFLPLAWHSFIDGAANEWQAPRLISGVDVGPQMYGKVMIRKEDFFATNVNYVKPKMLCKITIIILIIYRRLGTDPSKSGLVNIQ